MTEESRGDQQTSEDKASRKAIIIWVIIAVAVTVPITCIGTFIGTSYFWQIGSDLAVEATLTTTAADRAAQATSQPAPPPQFCALRILSRSEPGQSRQTGI